MASVVFFSKKLKYRNANIDEDLKWLMDNPLATIKTQWY